MMRTRLPLELRELVYQHLYLEDGTVPVGAYHFTTYVPEPLRAEANNPPAHSEPFIVVPHGATRQDHSIERDESIVYPDSWLLDPSYLGSEMAREASEYYYKWNTFSVCTLENTLSEFLFEDVAHNFTGAPGTMPIVEPLGLIPIDHIRKLQIRVKYEHYSAHAEFYDKPLCDGGERYLIQGVFDTLRGLSSHISNDNGPRLHIEICLMTRMTPEPGGFIGMRKCDRVFTNLLEAVRVPVYMLKHDLSIDVKVIHYDEYCRPFPKDITFIFKVPKDEWSKEKKAFENAGIEYSPWQYFISRERGERALRRANYNIFSLAPILEHRWGLKTPLDSQSIYPIRNWGIWPNTLPEAARE